MNVYQLTSALLQQHLLNQVAMPVAEPVEITRVLQYNDELVGCIIGRGGSKINSIRRVGLLISMSTHTWLSAKLPIKISV